MNSITRARRNALLILAGLLLFSAAAQAAPQQAASAPIPAPPSSPTSASSVRDGSNGSDVQFMKDHPGALDNAEWKKGLKVLFVGVGTSDHIAYPSSQAMVAILKTHGFTVDEHQSGGGHSRMNWRNYLYEFAPLLFQ